MSGDEPVEALLRRGIADVDAGMPDPPLCAAVFLQVVDSQQRTGSADR